MALLATQAGTARAQQLMGDIGVKLSERDVLHVGVAAEAGYDTNVFFNDDAPTQSAVLRVVPSFHITNNGRDGSPRSAIVYTLGANLVYREYLNDNPNVRAQRAFIPTLFLNLGISGEKTKFTLADQFTRTEDAPYAEGQPPITRDTNQGSATVSFSPGGGRLTTSLRYTNTFDLFEASSGYSGASTLSHDGTLDVGWKWLPKTALFLQVGAGYVDYFKGDMVAGLTPRHDSIPIRALAGVRGLVTPKTTVNLGAGYATAFYQEGSGNPSGVSNIAVTAEIGYLPTLLTRLSLGYAHGFRNSPVIGDYYDVDSLTLQLNHTLGRFVAAASASGEYRRYHNYAVPRRDLVLIGGVGLDYFIQKWFYAGASYNILFDRPENDPNAVKYTKHQVFGRLGIAY